MHWITLKRALLFLLLLATLSTRAKAENWDLQSDTWVATDALGRSLPTSAQCGPPRTNRFAGIFYFLWLEGQGPAHDLTKLIAQNPENPAFGPPSSFHFWSEPLFGYYRADDPFIIRKHALMLTAAGIDVIIFDVTNGPTYRDKYLALCKIYEEMRASGQHTPQIAFITHSSSKQVVSILMKEFYSQKEYSNLWFYWKGKPLILTDHEVEEQARNFFTVRESWAWSDPKGWFADGHDKWPWLDHTPQRFGWHEPGKPEQVCVCVAEHPVSNIGRSFHNGAQPAQTTSERGLYFAEQWKQALKIDPEFVFITGWNEWIAQRFLNNGNIQMMGKPVPTNGTFFVDTYNQEFSRDIEPMKGGHGDNYYYQLAANIRRFKGARPIQPVTPGPVIIDGKFDDWRSITPEFLDSIDDPVHRKHPSWVGEPPFVNNSGRNDIKSSKVSCDTSNLYFYVQTKAALTPCSDTNWMLLYLDADSDPSTGWLGYDFAINRSHVTPNSTTLERCTGGNHWETVATLSCRSAENELEIAIPRTDLSLNRTDVILDFKWADNCFQTGDSTDFSLNGDTAPNDRFNYRAILK